MKIVFASTNKGKIREIKEILSEYEVLSLEDISFNEDIIEDGNSFTENALIKARKVFNYSHMLTLADDSGLEVESLHNEPGIFSARYAGTHNDDDNNRLLLKNLDGIKNRKARYVCALAAILPDGTEKTYLGILEGEIIDDYRGSNGFGYDPLFYLPAYQKTSAEISREEKNKISHRGKALRLFLEDMKK